MKRKVLTALAILLLGCEPPHTIDDSLDPAGKADAVSAADGGVTSEPVASIDQPDTVDVGVWNLEWYGDLTHGPVDEETQQDNVRTILSTLQFDLVGLVEIVSPDAFEMLLDGLPGFGGVLVTDPIVSQGSEYYRPREQKVALVFRDRFEVVSARVILTDHSWDFAGRPPLEVKLRFWEAGKPRTLVVVIAHFKAMATAAGHERRATAAVALEAFLSQEYPTRWVLVLGDFNDDIDTSTYAGHESPFASLVESPDYRFATEALSADGISTTTHYPSTIDHHLITNDLAERFVEGSARVLRVDRDIEDYADTTSDHYPVLTRYDLR
jgi:endonuclease/exonuclease/phosphatase family metal-dependent hydrolase